MPRMIVSIDGVVIKEVQLTKERTTLGRRPYNDIVIDNPAVSGEHAVLQMVGADVFIEDLNSTNGTYINGKAIKKQLLAHNDTVEIVDSRTREVVASLKPGPAVLHMEFTGRGDELWLSARDDNTQDQPGRSSADDQMRHLAAEVDAVLLRAAGIGAEELFGKRGQHEDRQRDHARNHHRRRPADRELRDQRGEDAAERRDQRMPAETGDEQRSGDRKSVV
mgnify:CR=1 FL=1